MRSGWFDCTEPALSTSLQGKQGTSSNLHYETLCRGSKVTLTVGVSDRGQYHRLLLLVTAGVREHTAHA